MPLHPLAPQPAPLPQEQKEEKIDLLDISRKLFFASTFQLEEFQRRIREGKAVDFINTLPELSPPPMRTTSENNNNNNSKKIEGEANLTTENTKKEEQLKEDRYDIEELPSSKSDLLMDIEDVYGDSSNIDYDDDYSSDVFG
jgi:hypothetical protein